MKISYAEYTDVGGRGNNEDALSVTVADHGHLFLVADGLGGHDNGEEASGLAVEEIKRIFTESGAAFDPEKAIISANELILNKQKEEGSSMKTTITLAWVKEKMTVFAHVGDSRIYAFDKNSIVYQSPDHSVSYLAVKMGEISLAEIRNHRDRNKLTRALGVSEDVSVHISTLNNSDYMGLLLCSDGLWEYVYEDEMVELLQSNDSPKAWIEEMRKLHAKRVDGKHDNNTAVAVITDGYNPVLKDLETTKAFSVPSMAPKPMFRTAPKPMPDMAPKASAPAAANRVASAGPALARGGAAPPKPKKKGSKAVMGLVILCVLLVLIILGLIVFMFILKDKEKDEKDNVSAEVSVESVETSEDSVAEDSGFAEESATNGNEDGTSTAPDANESVVAPDNNNEGDNVGGGSEQSDPPFEGSSEEMSTEETTAEITSEESMEEAINSEETYEEDETVEESAESVESVENSEYTEEGQSAEEETTEAVTSDAEDVSGAGSETEENEDEDNDSDFFNGLIPGF